MRLRYRYVSYGGGRHVVDQMQSVHQLMHQMLARATPGSTGAWQPPTDVYETDDALVVRVELAGVREEKVDITLFADHLTIAGARQNPATADAAYHLAGILYGDFRLEIPLVAPVRRDEVQASYENGLLTVTLPKAVQRDAPTSVRIEAQNEPETTVQPQRDPEPITGGIHHGD